MMKNYLNGNYQPKIQVKKVDQEPIKWLRSKDVRQMLGISDSTLQTLRINNGLPAYRLGSSWFYRQDEIENALMSGRTKGRNGQNG